MWFTIVRGWWTNAWPLFKKILLSVLRSPIALWILRKAIVALYKWNREESDCPPVPIT
jgi:hypothetical protein